MRRRFLLLCGAAGCWLTSAAVRSPTKGGDMWIQVIKAKLKPGVDREYADVIAKLEAMEQPGSGLVRSTAARDQKDPSTVYMIVTFESEEKARARESDPKRQEALGPVRELMARIFDGPPEFLDLEVVTEYAGR